MPVRIWATADGGEAEVVLRGRCQDGDLAEGLGAILFLIAAFGIPDLHRENLMETDQGLAVLDGETWCAYSALPPEGPPDVVRDTVRRIDESGVSDWLESEGFFGSRRPLLDKVIAELPRLMVHLRSCWDDLATVRHEVTGLQTRYLGCDSARFTKMIPYAQDPELREELRNMLASHPIYKKSLDIDAVIFSLQRGWIPKSMVRIEPPDHPAFFAHMPCEEMGSTLRAIFGTARNNQEQPLAAAARALSVGSSVGLRFLGRMKPGPKPEGLRRSTGVDPVVLNPRGLGDGLIGLGLLDHAQRLLGAERTLDDESSKALHAQIQTGILEGRVEDTSLAAGFAGELLYAVALGAMGMPCEAEWENIKRRIQRELPTTEPWDLFYGTPGLLLALARGKAFLGDMVDAEGARAFQQVDAQAALTLEAEKPELGFAHGLAGVAFALGHGERAGFGRSTNLGRLIEKLRGLLAARDWRPFEAVGVCRSPHGLAGVLRQVAPEALEGIDLSGAPEWRTHGVCHGRDGYALVTGKWPARPGQGRRPGVSKDGDAFGYLYGASGQAYAALAEESPGHRLLDPVWGLWFPGADQSE